MMLYLKAWHHPASLRLAAFDVAWSSNSWPPLASIFTFNLHGPRMAWSKIPSEPMVPSPQANKTLFVPVYQCLPKSDLVQLRF